MCSNVFIRLFIVFFGALSFLATPTVDAKSHRSSSKSSYSVSSKKTVKVRNYHKKNGTNIRSHYRHAPKK